VPVTVTVEVPAVAVLLAVRVSVLAPVAGFGLNEAVKPAGRPETVRLTALLKPFCAPMLMVVVVLEPWVTLTLLGEAESVKFGPAPTVSETVAVLVKLPDVPVTVTVAVPVAAVLLAVRVSVLEPVAGFGLNEAVTPPGRPEAERLTLPLKPFWALIVMVLVPLAPCAMLTLVGDADKLKAGGAKVTVSGTALLAFMDGATRTDRGPEVAPVGMVTVTDVSLHEFAGSKAPFNVTMLLP